MQETKIIERPKRRGASFREYTLSDFKKLQFKGGGKYTGRDIDSIVYAPYKLLKK
ncbi:hypothetical protein HY732_01750 [Candidatus Uhrbacteria bacterium]|nr:hypothetical protein [Candidatus Uhrbacteria bacterium]